MNKVEQTFILLEKLVDLRQELKVLANAVGELTKDYLVDCPNFSDKEQALQLITQLTTARNTISPHFAEYMGANGMPWIFTTILDRLDTRNSKREQDILNKYNPDYEYGVLDSEPLDLIS